MSRHPNRDGQVLLHVGWARDPESVPDTQQFGHDYVIQNLGNERGPVSWQITDGSKAEALTMLERLGEGRPNPAWVAMLAEIADMVEQGPDDDGGHVVVTMCDYRPHTKNRAQRRAHRKKRR